MPQEEVPRIIPTETDGNGGHDYSRTRDKAKAHQEDGAKAEAQEARK